MKRSLNSLLNQLSNTEMKNLTKMIDETIALGSVQPTRHIFTAADLWKIHRNSKPRNHRKYF